MTSGNLSQEVRFRLRSGEVSHEKNAVKDVQSKQAKCKRCGPGDPPKKGGQCGWSKGSKEEGYADQQDSDRSQVTRTLGESPKRLVFSQKKLRNYLNKRSDV